MLNYTNSFEVGNSKLDMTVLLGNNLNHIYNKRSTIISKGLVVPDYYNVKNISGSADVSTYLSKKRTVGNYAQVDLALDDFLFFVITSYSIHYTKLYELCKLRNGEKQISW